MRIRQMMSHCPCCNRKHIVIPYVHRNYSNKLDSRPHSELGALQKLFYWSGFFPIRLTIGPACKDAATNLGFLLGYTKKLAIDSVAVSYGLLVKFAI